MRQFFGSNIRTARPAWAAMLLLGTSIWLSPCSAQSVVPFSAAHAHNDYAHRRPLLDALDQGFCSIEADIFLVDGQLLVGHSRRELTTDRTLARLYLDPLRQRVEQNGGRVYPDGPTLTLLIDIKSDGPGTYQTLHALLANYTSMLARVEDGQRHEGAVQVIISGSRPIDLIAAANPRLAFVDGRVADLDGSLPADLVPLISDRWSAHFDWRGTGPFPAEQLDKLRDIVQRAHRQGQRVRFWETADRPEVWRVLRDAEVDLINTDDLPGLAAFLSPSRQSSP